MVGDRWPANARVNAHIIHYRYYIILFKKAEHIYEIGISLTAQQCRTVFGVRKKKTKKHGSHQKWN